MTAVWGCVALLIIAFVPQTILAQGENPTGDAPAPGKDEKAPPAPAPVPAPEVPRTLKDDDNSTVVGGNTLFGPVESADIYDTFRYENYDYLFVRQAVQHSSSKILCEGVYKGELAIIATDVLALFLAEALSETNLILDSLWTAGQNLSFGENATLGKKWYWVEASGEKTEIAEALQKQFTESKEVQADDRDCLTFARKDHDVPQYQPITCMAKRPYLCVRPAGGGDNNGSTHPGWIKLGRRLYKIFSDPKNYEESNEFCVQLGVQSTLAVVVNYHHSQQLGRYLLIGRPSLENGWIGAKWIYDHYAFEAENRPLPNKTDEKHYPPWRGLHVKKVGGCILLDRHISNITLFVEARCERLRPIICYRMDPNAYGNISFSDVIIEPHGYRIIYNNRSWEEARDFCKNEYAKYGSKLVEIDAAVHVPNLLYAMGENKTAIQHIWIGGRLNTTLSPPVWAWDSTGAEVDKSILTWIKNQTYTDSVESSYVCMNMDRENHLVALHYGTRCTFWQPFVCYFSADNLRALEKYEANVTINIDD